MKKAILTISHVWETSGVPWEAFTARTGHDGLHITLLPDAVYVKLDVVLQPQRFPFVFPNPTGDRATLLQQAYDWIAAHPALQQIYPNGFTVVWST